VGKLHGAMLATEPTDATSYQYRLCDATSAMHRLQMATYDYRHPPPTTKPTICYINLALATEDLLFPDVEARVTPTY
jgi:hypothetical protein